MSLPRLLAGVRGDRPLGHREHVAVHGPMPPAGPQLLAELRRAELGGRGGASFPTAAKLEAVRARRGPSVVVVNGAEGEPLSAKDRTLMALTPHLVLDGALAAADLVGADRVIVAVRSDAGDALRCLDAAVAGREGRRRVDVVAVPATHLAGEETALIAHLGGGPLRPTRTPPRPAERGLRRRPTLVQNVETLAQLALVARHGAAWWRAIGTAATPGSVLVTLCGAVARPGVSEIAYGTSAGALLDAAGGATEPVRAVLVGGYHGTWIGGEAIAAVTLDDAELARHGARLAAGVIVVLGGSACPVRETVTVLSYLAAQSAGQCGPCANGLPAIADLLGRVAAGDAPADAVTTLRRWARQLHGRGACRLPDGAVHFLGSSLGTFAAEFETHARRGPCAACDRPPVLLASPARARAAA